MSHAFARVRQHSDSEFLNPAGPLSLVSQSDFDPLSNRRGVDRAAFRCAVAVRDGISYALPFDLAFVAALIALIFIDAEHMILPNVITYPGIIFAVLTRDCACLISSGRHSSMICRDCSARLPQLPVWSVSLIGAAIGALVGGGSLWLMGFLWEKLRGVEAMGLGDVKMMFMVGALSRMASRGTHDLLRRFYRLARGHRGDGQARHETCR